MGKKRSSRGGKVKKPSWWRVPFFKFLFVFVCLLAVFLLYQDFSLRKKFSGKRWSIPAHVFARPLELYQGLELSADQFVEELGLLGYLVDPSVEFSGSFSHSSGLRGDEFSIHKRFFQFPQGPEIAQVFHVSIQGSKVVSLRGVGDKSLAIVRLDPMKIGTIHPSHFEDRVLVRLKDVPDLLPKILLTAEDRHFYGHFGISFSGIVRAFFANLKAGSTVQGGSTITQQLVKNFFLDRRRTIVRKLHEVLLSFMLEFHYEKDDILEAYLNEVYLGQDGKRAIHGFGLASQFYFGKSVEEVNTGQLALLVALVKGPSFYNPFKHSERALDRRNTVLRQLFDQKIISYNELHRALRLPLGVVKKKSRPVNVFPGFLALVHRQLLENYSAEDLQSEGLRIFTPLDPLLQSLVSRSVPKSLGKIEKRFRLPKKHLESAVVMTNRQNGEVVALSGGRREVVKGFNRALDARRPIGSLVKPAVYAAALQIAPKFTLASWLFDEPIFVAQRGSDVWSPSNYDDISHGQVMLYQALSHSFNQATVQLGMDLGIDNVISTLKALGVEQDIPRFPSLFLGALNLSPFEVAQMYQSLSSGGFYSPLRAIRSVLNNEGQVSSSFSTSVESRLDAESSYLVHFALQQVMKDGTGQSVYRSISNDVVLAGKTGTTNDLRDSWFAGYSHRFLTVVWVGNDDNESIKASGSSGALPLWIEIMSGVKPKSVIWPQPSGVDWFDIDSSTGYLSFDHCGAVVKLPFIKGSQPVERSCQPKGMLKWFQDLL